MELDFLKLVIFCPRCKNDLAPRDTHVKICTSCGYKFYYPIAPTNGAILLNEKQEILLVERKFDPHKGMLDVPGGFINVGETAEESMVRELKEELGVEISQEKLQYYMGPCDQYFFQNEWIPTICFMFIAHLPQGAHPHAMDDANKVLYFKPQDIPLEKIAFKAIRKALEGYIKNLYTPFT